MNKIYLTTTYQEKDKVKALGARFDVDQKKWFIYPDSELQPFKRWLPVDIQSTLGHETKTEMINEKGIALSELIQSVSNKINICFPELIWVRVEISSIKHNNGSYYFDFVEVGATKNIVAKIEGVLWPQQNQTIQHFEKITGTILSANLKILIQVKIEIHAKSGLRLKVMNIDPYFTLGDMAAKIKAIKDKLYANDIINNNKCLLTPKDFTNIVVISPREGASLGDFTSIANKLESTGVCKFTYLKAVFQGAEAPSSLMNAINKVINTMPVLPDAIVIIRGGGSVSDLHWLNDYELAKTICLCPIPIFTGIGHEKDNTVMDDVANNKFGTPSKVASHILDTINLGTMLAERNWKEICNIGFKIVVHVNGVFSSNYRAIYQDALSLTTNINENILKYGSNIQHNIKYIIINIEYNVNNITTTIVNDINNVINNKNNIINQFLNETRSGISNKLWKIQNLITDTNHNIKNNVNRMTDMLQIKSKNHFDFIKTSATYHLDSSKNVIENVYYDKIFKTLVNTFKFIEDKCITFIELINSNSPMIVLRRGYAIIKKDNQYTKSAKCIQKNDFIEIQYFDGVIHANVTKIGEIK